MSVQRILVLVTRTLIVLTMTVLIAALVTKGLLEMVHFAKVSESRPWSQNSSSRLAPSSLSHPSLI